MLALIAQKQHTKITPFIQILLKYISSIFSCISHRTQSLGDTYLKTWMIIPPMKLLDAWWKQKSALPGSFFM